MNSTTRHTPKIVTTTLLCTVLTVPAFGQAPSTLRVSIDGLISYQGQLIRDIGEPLDSTDVGMTFRLYKGATEIWSESQSVDVEKGIFEVLLGTLVSLDTVAFNQPIDLGVTLNGEGTEMTPRTPLAAGAFALGMRGMYAVESGGLGSLWGVNIVGGASNNSLQPNALGATISGGGGWMSDGNMGNEAGGNWPTVGGGALNDAVGYAATVSGGEGNTSRADYATVGGGSSNHAGGNFATIPGGYNNFATKEYTFAAGRLAKADHKGAFVWSDAGTWDQFISTGDNQFLIRASGGVGIGTNAPQEVISNAQFTVAAGHVAVSNNFGFLSANADSTSFGAGLDTTVDDDLHLYAGGGGKVTVQADGKVGIGPFLAPNYPLQVGTLGTGTGGNGAHVTSGGVWISTSSRAVKEKFRDIDVADLLQRVVDLPVQRWEYRGSEEGEHLGPMAEDFYAAFGLGDNDSGISMIDADGVALAAIQGLYKLVREQQAEIESLRRIVGGGQ